MEIQSQFLLTQHLFSSLQNPMKHQMRKPTIHWDPRVFIWNHSFSFLYSEFIFIVLVICSLLGQMKGTDQECFSASLFPERQFPVPDDPMCNSWSHTDLGWSHVHPAEPVYILVDRNLRNRWRSWPWNMLVITENVTPLSDLVPQAWGWIEQSIKILVTQKLPGKKSTYGNHWGHTFLHCLYMAFLT